MTRLEALKLARKVADDFQNWYEIHTNGTDYIVLEAGDTYPGYTHEMSISPNVKVPNGKTN